MGQYVSVGIHTHVVADVEPFKAGGIPADTWKEVIAAYLNLDESLYDFNLQNDTFVAKLKTDIDFENLYPLLKETYPIYYKTASTRCLESIASTLNSIKGCKNWAEFTKLAAENREFLFSSPTYNFMYPDIVFNCKVMLYVKSICISSEGKIVSEGIENILEMTTRLLRDKLSSNPLATALNVFITG